MSLDIEAIAKDINSAIGATDKDGLPIEVTDEMKTYAEAIVTTLQGAIVNHLLVTGITAPGAPLSAGAAQNGLTTNILPLTWLGVMILGFPTSDPASLALEAAGSTAYLQASALINFLPETITGTCTSTPVSPGPLALGAGEGGTVDALSGDDWAKLVSPPLGDPALAAKIYTAIVKRINSDAQAKYISGTVTGTCPAAGGPLALGLGTGGIIE